MAIQKPFLVEQLALGAVASGNEKTFRPALNLGRFDDPGKVWETTGASNIWARGNFGSAKEVDFVALLSTNAGTGTRARIRLGDTQAEVDGTADYDSGFQVIRTPALTHWSGLYHWYWELPSLQTKQWWRIDADSHSGDFRSMALVMGKRFQLQEFYNHTGGISFGQQDMGKLDFGQFGVNDQEDGIKMRTLGMEFAWMNRNDRREFQRVRDRLGQTGMAYWCFDGEPTEDRQENQYFGWLRRPLVFQPTTFAQDRFGVQVEIISII